MNIKIYTTKYCGFCHRAKQILESKNLTFDEIPLDDNPTLRKQISEANEGYSTVPMIFIDDKFIGGFTELASEAQRGKLNK
ncbi:MAG: glutaredoxin [Zetaproteobacteria bacterium]|nr:glutaredoxin [Pseudobdellovibrionaceae bacterium]